MTGKEMLAVHGIECKKVPPSIGFFMPVEKWGYLKRHCPCWFCRGAPAFLAEDGEEYHFIALDAVMDLAATRNAQIKTNKIPILADRRKEMESQGD